MNRVFRRSRGEREYDEIVTERRRAEKEAQDLFEHSTDALGTVGFDGYYRRANPALVQAFGYPVDELFARPIFDIIHPDDVEPTRAAFTKVLEGEELIGFEARHICADGSVRWFQWNARPDLDEQVIYGVGRDVTESRLARREFEEIFNVSPDLLGIVGFDARFTRVNPAFEQAFGYSSEELSSRPIFEFVHPDDVPKSREEFERATRGKTVTGFENRNIRADGTLLWLEWSARPLMDEGIIYAAARDITDRKRREAELRDARKDVDASRAELAVYAEDQAALRRVATLVAEGASSGEVLDRVVFEVGRLFGAHATRLHRYEGDDAATVVAVHGSGEDFQVGTRLTLEGESITASIRRTGRPARMQSYEQASGRIAAQARAMGVRSAVGTPITVEGALWGVIIASWTQKEPPFAEAEARMAAFTELVATAIANAESRAQLDVHLEQQAALRRMATLVAQGASPQDLFDAVAEELGRLLSVESATMGRFEPDDNVTPLASWSTTEAAFFPTGRRFPTEGTNVAGLVLQTGRTARIDDYSAATDPIGVAVREAGIKSVVGSPIVVKGQLWGLIAAASTEGPMPPDTESRLAAFTELVATAIANAESRAQLDVHVEQQAALRRVATLVAEDVPPSELFEAVAREVGALLGGDFAGLARFEQDAVVTVGVWAADGEHPPVPPRWPMQQGDPATMIAESREPLRWDDWTEVPGPIAEFIRGLGIRSTVGTPIVVAGRLWGALALHSRQSAPLPPGTESRMAQFTDLVATAIANREARAEVDRLAQEQAALRRVATLVARDVPSSDIMSAVVSEVVQLLQTDLAILIRFDPGDQMTLLTTAGSAAESMPVGTRRKTAEGVARKVRNSGRPGRLDHVDRVPGTWGAVASDAGLRSSVGAPIAVEGRVWGMIGVATTGADPLPPDTDDRLAQFTELVATAIANTESRDEVQRLADEQAALRRVAVLVAQQPSPGEVFTAVTRAVGLLLDADLAVLHVFGDDTSTTIASWSGGGQMLPVGTRFPLDGDGLAARIFESGAPARIHSNEEAWEQAETDIARSLHLRSAVGAPILVEGKLWGALMAATRTEPWAENAETRLAAFTELVATALASAEARDALTQLAEEQAALRRVATLVAQEALPQDLFDAVAEELGRLLSVESATMGRFESDDSVIAVASWSPTEETAFPIGGRWPIEGTNIAWIVRHTGRTARIDDFSGAADPLGVTVREAGIESAVGSPIVVNGHVWGLITAATTEGPMPPDTEARLASFTELVATAIANAESWSELAASRARVIAASAEERRRVVRDLHDGAQQRLVHSVINMKLALRELGRSDQHAEKHMSEALDHAEQANLELRELVYGILPGALTSGGLRAGVGELASRSTLPVTFDVPAARLPTTIEATAYFVVSELLTNAVKHAQAHTAEVTAQLDNGTLLVEVRDDGVGGADPNRGSGLTGLRDRVEALGGTIEISSPAGSGTSVTARLPAE